MNIIHFSTVFRRLDHFVKLHNSNSDTLSTHLRQSIVATAKEIIKIYSISLLKTHKTKPLDLDNIPPLETNSAQLATMSNVSPRTIRRHIRRLLEANVLTEKVYKGRKSNYELRFNSNILLINGVQAVKKHENLNKSGKRKSADNQFFKNTIRTSCPQSDSSNNSYIHNIIIGVDKKLEADNQRSSLTLTANHFSSNESSNIFSRYVEEEGAKRNNEPLSQNAPGAQKFHQKEEESHQNYSCSQSCNGVEEEGKSAEAKRQAKDIDSRLEASRFTSLNLYVDSLWKLAKNTLYENVYLTENQQKKAKELLQLWYEPVKDHQLNKVHSVYIDRIELVRKYIAKDPENRFVQLPHRYFDPNNKYGFTGTKVWYENHMRSKQKTRLKLILHAQIRRFINNEKKGTAFQKSRLQMFRQCETRIGKLNNQELMNQFYASILEKSTFNFLQFNT